jgi:uncharacterized membrane protein YjfL (UPF0719 family)
MNKQSLFFTFLVAIVVLLIAFNLLILFAKKSKVKTDNTNLSLVLWYSTILVPFFLLLKPALNMIENSIELLIYANSVNNTFISVMEKIIIYSGLTFVFTIVVYLLIEKISIFILDKRDVSIEIENNNYAYFIFKLLISSLFIYVLLSTYEYFLRWFLPVFNTPFYH